MKPCISRAILLLGGLLQLPSRLPVAAAGSLPLVVTTWFAEATDVAWAAINLANTSTPALDAIELVNAGAPGCSLYACALAHGRQPPHDEGML